MYTQTEKVNIKPKSYLPEFHVSQNDVGRTLTAHLVSDDGDVTIPAGATVTMAGTKPSGLGYTVTGTVDGTDVSFETDAVMTDEPGRIVSEIRIVQDGIVIGTTNVVLSVEPNPHPDDTTDGRREPLVNEITALLEQITEQADRVEEYSGKVLNMTVTAHESDEVTVTKTDGEVVNLDFGLPRGPQGPQGIPGEDGQDGVTPDFTIGTVETLAPGEQATATITGTDEDPVLNLGIPQGVKGDKGDTGEVSLETLAKVMVSDTASGTIASFTDGSDVLPAKSVLVTLEPIQDLHGYDKPWVGGAGKNKLDDSIVSSLSNLTYQSGVATEIEADSRNNVVFVLQAYNNGTYVRNLGTPYGNAQQLLFTKDSTFNQINFGNSGSTKDAKLRFDVSNLPDGEYKWCFTPINYTTHPFSWKDMMIVESSVTDYSYEPYTNICPISGWDEVETHISPTTDAHDGQTITTTLPTTVYGGTLDVVSGVLTVTHGYISPYNGETINEPWISDRDEYVAGTTPTTGAQVVYLLATPTTIQCDPQTVQTLIGDNNVWGGSGVSIDYYADTKLYIEKMLGV